MPHMGFLISLAVSAAVPSPGGRAALWRNRNGSKEVLPAEDNTEGISRVFHRPAKA